MDTLFSYMFNCHPPACLSPIICSSVVTSVETPGQDPLRSVATQWGREPLRLGLISRQGLASDFPRISNWAELGDGLRPVFAWTRGEGRLLWEEGLDVAPFPRPLILCSWTFNHRSHWGGNCGVSSRLLQLLGTAVPRGWNSPHGHAGDSVPEKKKKKKRSF